MVLLHYIGTRLPNKFPRQSLNLKLKSSSTNPSSRHPPFHNTSQKTSLKPNRVKKRMTNAATITHRTITVNGITMHVAEEGGGGDDGSFRPVVLFVHGFPETWYAWRHQLRAFSSLGYRAIAPDLRGYGDTDSPLSPSEYTCHHVVGDLLALMDSLRVKSFYLVAHDCGALIGWYLCMFRPDRVRAYVCLTVPFRPRHPRMKPVGALRAYFGDDYYICRFQKPGDIESEIKQAGVRNVIKLILTGRKPGPPMLPKGKSFRVPPGVEIPLPSWLSEDDIDCFSRSFEKKGFTGGLNYYRAMDLNWELTAAWTDVQIKVPVKFVVGDLDMTYTTPGVKEYVHGEGFKKDVPLLEDVVVMKGVGHFINQEKPQEINAYIHDFIKKY